MKISLKDAYLSHKDSFRTVDEFIELILHKDVPVYFYTSPIEIKNGEFLEDKTEIKEGSIPQYFKDALQAEGIVFDSEYGGEDIDPATLEITSKHIDKFHKPEALELPREILSKKWQGEMSLFREFFDMSKGTVEAHRHISITIADLVSAIDKKTICVGDLLISKEDFEPLVNIYHKLLAMIEPSDDFSSAYIVSPDGEKIKERYIESQSIVLKMLFENSLHNPDYRLSFAEIKKVKSLAPESYKPGSLFRNKVVRSYIKQEKHSLFFDFSKK